MEKKPNSTKQQIPPKMVSVLLPLILFHYSLSSDKQIEEVHFLGDM